MIDIDESLNMMEMDAEFYKEIGSLMAATSTSIKLLRFIKHDFRGGKTKSQSKKARENVLRMKQKLGVLKDPVDVAALNIIEADSNFEALAALQAKYSNLEEDLKSLHKLPVQDALWIIGTFECVKYENTEDRYILAVQESFGGERHTLKASICGSQGGSISTALLHLFAQACLHPNVKTPRRPSNLRVVSFSNDLNSYRDLAVLQHNLGTTVFLPGTPSHVLNEAESGSSDCHDFRSCTSCSRRGEEAMFDLCSACNAVFFCDSECKRISDHDMWCQCFKEFMKYEKTMGTFPFSFCEETTANSFNAYKHCDFLRRHGVFGRGIWRRQSKLTTSTISNVYGELDSPPLGTYCLGPEDQLLQGPPTQGPPTQGPPTQGPPTQGPPTPRGAQAPALASWGDYYRFRGLKLGSPVAAVLHYAMTLYTVVTSLLPQSYPATSRQVQQSGRLCVHVIGAAQEVDMWRSFLECAHLLYPVHLHICFIGNEVSPKVHGKQLSEYNLKVQIFSGLYHEVASTLPKADLALSFNAGLGAYETYKPTVHYLMARGIPAVCTDYCLASHHQSRRAVTAARVAGLSTPWLNPFRSPLRMVFSDLQLPRYSNAVIFMIKKFEPNKLDADDCMKVVLRVGDYCEEDDYKKAVCDIQDKLI